MDFTALDQYLRHVAAVGPSGCAVSVNLGGETVFTGCYGVESEQTMQPVSEQTLFRMYSVSKVITAVAVMKLYEKGAFALDDPLCRYLPEFSAPQVLKGAANNAIVCVPAREPITIRHLLTMTAGLAYDSQLDPVSWQTTQLMQRLNRGAYSVREFSREIAKLPLAFEPGCGYRYSFCLDVAGALVEELSGKRFGKFLEDEIFEPLGMEDSGFFFEDLRKEHLAEFYSLDADGKRYVDPIDDNAYCKSRGYESGGAGVLSTLADMTKFASALANGGNGILGRKTIDLMRQDHLCGKAREDFCAATQNPAWRLLKGYSYGLGVRTLVSLAESGLNGSIGEFGWGSVGGSFIVCDPQERLSICYLHQLHQPDNMENEITPRVKAMVYSQLA